MYRLLFCGLVGCRIDGDMNLTYVGEVKTDRVIIPYGVRGLKGTCLSGLDFTSLKLNTDLEVIEDTALANCRNFRELQAHQKQAGIVAFLSRMYPELNVVLYGDLEYVHMPGKF